MPNSITPRPPVKRFGIIIAGFLVVGLIAFACVIIIGSSASQSRSVLLDEPPVTISSLAANPQPEVDPLAVPVPSSDYSDPAEAALMSSLTTSTTVPESDGVPLSIQTDPSQGRITITFGYRQKQGISPSRADILVLASHFMKDLGHITDPATYPLITVRCLLLPRQGNELAPLAFIGEMDKSTALTLPNDLNTMSINQLLASFKNPWWSSSAPL